MACEALAAEVELWQRVTKKHQGALGLSPGSGGVGQLGSPFHLQRGTKRACARKPRPGGSAKSLTGC